MNVRSPAGLRRHYRRQTERRRQKSRERALARLTDPISLVLEAGGSTRMPISFLPLHELKVRVQELNTALELGRFDFEKATDSSNAPKPPVVPADPPRAEATTVFSLTELEHVHAGGQEVYQSMVRQGLLAPATGAGWAFLKYEELSNALPEMKFDWKRYRRRYLVQACRNSADEITALRFFSVNYTPIIERGFDRSSSP